MVTRGARACGLAERTDSKYDCCPNLLCLRVANASSRSWCASCVKTSTCPCNGKRCVPGHTEHSAPFKTFHDHRVFLPPYCLATYALPVDCSRPRNVAFPLQRRTTPDIFEDTQCIHVRGWWEEIGCLLQQNKKRRRSGETCHVFNYDAQRSR